jgi:hypothetical protein
MSWHGTHGLVDRNGSPLYPPYKVFRDMRGRKPYDAFPNPTSAFQAALESVGRCYGTEITGNSGSGETIWCRIDMSGNVEFLTDWRP